MADADKKIQAIKDFLFDLAEIRAAVKKDCKTMLSSIPIEILDNEESLAAYLEEMAQVIARKYLISEDNKTVVKQTGKIINKYVEAMLKK